MARRGGQAGQRLEQSYVAFPPPPPPRMVNMASVSKGGLTQWVCACCNLLNWDSRRNCRECGASQRLAHGVIPRMDSPPRRLRARHEPNQRHPRPPLVAPAPPKASPFMPPHASTAGPPADVPVAPLPLHKRIQALKEALEALRAANAPPALSTPLNTELQNAEEELRRRQPMGQQLDHARAAFRKAETKLEAANTSLCHAAERQERAEEEHSKKVKELQTLEEDLAAAAPPLAKAEELAAAVAAALDSPAQYNVAALRAAYARYTDEADRPASASEGSAVVPSEIAASVGSGTATPRTAPPPGPAPLTPRQPAPAAPPTAPIPGDPLETQTVSDHEMEEVPSPPSPGDPVMPPAQRHRHGEAATSASWS